jgi:hypothetical protein
MIGGLNGLVVHSHRLHQFPQRTDAAVEALILAESQLHRTGAQEVAQGPVVEARDPVTSGAQHDWRDSTAAWRVHGATTQTGNVRCAQREVG